MSSDDDFSAYVGLRWAALVRTALLLGCERHEAEDVVQSALLRCYLHWERVWRAERVDAYVHRVLLNTLSSARGRRWRGEVPTAELPELPSIDGRLDDRRTDLERVLSRLSAEHRAVLVLRYVADLSEAQTADALGVAVGTVKSRTARALAAIDPAELRDDTVGETP